MNIEILGGTIKEEGKTIATFSFRGVENERISATCWIFGFGWWSFRETSIGSALEHLRWLMTTLVDLEAKHGKARAKAQVEAMQEESSGKPLTYMVRNGTGAYG